ncbi:MAG: glycoside hydrolase family 95 protein [Terracidiphilus sp.]
MKQSRRDFLKHSGMAAVTLSQSRASRAAALGPQAEASSSERVLWFTQPASEWTAALPVGNGWLGGMVFGIPDREHVQISDDGLWDGQVRNRNNPAAGKAVPEIRRLLFAGKVHEAEALAASSMLAIPRRLPMNETEGDLWLDFDLPGEVSGYRRQLDLRDAIAGVSFQSGGVAFRREFFSSAPDRVLAMRMEAGRKAALSFSAWLDRPASFAVETVGTNRLAMTGTALPVAPPTDPATEERYVGIGFRCEAILLAEGGEVRAADGRLQVTGADAVTLLLTSATSHRTPDMRAVCGQALQAAMQRSYRQLRERHRLDYRSYFDRSDVIFTHGRDPQADLPTDQRLARMKQGSSDEFLLETYYHFGRYLLISSSRPGTLAANLQGIWNKFTNPPWGCKYTLNINAEMNYWMAEAANLADVHEPLFALLETTRGPGSVTALDYYRARGFVVHHNTDIWGDAVPIDAVYSGIWAMGANWVSTHLWEHYQFSGDREFLARRAYPILRDMALFLLDYIVESPEGYLVTGPSLSPENRYYLPDGTKASLCMGPTMDIEITRAVLSQFVEASEILGMDELLRSRVIAARQRIPPIPISPEGRIQEWPKDYRETDPGHRHLSHLWALYPGSEITLRGTSALAEAARRSLLRRIDYGSGSTGWSRAWIVNLWARLEEGDRAHHQLNELLRRSTLSSLLDVCGEKPTSYYQIDGNLGGAAAVVEMLLQSHSGVLRFLPALPSAWPEGSLRGIRARGGLTVDLAWQQGKAQRAVLRCNRGGSRVLAAPRGQRVASVSCRGRRVSTEITPDGNTRFGTTQGETYRVTFADA